MKTDAILPRDGTPVHICQTAELRAVHRAARRPSTRCNGPTCSGSVKTAKCILFTGANERRIPADPSDGDGIAQHLSPVLKGTIEHLPGLAVVRSGARPPKLRSYSQGKLVPEAGFEPAHSFRAPPPQDGVSA